MSRALPCEVHTVRLADGKTGGGERSYNLSSVFSYMNIYVHTYMPKLVTKKYKNTHNFLI